MSANRLWIHRKKMGYSQKEVARRLGYRSATHISDYERGVRLPSLETALKLEIILCAPVAFLFRELTLKLKGDIQKARERAESQSPSINPSTGSGHRSEHRYDPNP